MIMLLHTFMRKYGGQEIKVFILDGTVEGSFPRRALSHVLEWYELHRDELLVDWQLCERNETPNAIEPLE
jgi:hypothetical protein